MIFRKFSFIKFTFSQHTLSTLQNFKMSYRTEAYYEKFIEHIEQFIEEFRMKVVKNSNATLKYRDLQENFGQYSITDYINTVVEMSIQDEEYDLSPPPCYMLKYTIEGKIVEEQIPNVVLSLPHGATDITITPVSGYLGILQNMLKSLRTFLKELKEIRAKRLSS